MTTYRVMANGTEQWEGEASDPQEALKAWWDAAEVPEGRRTLDGVQVWLLGDAVTVYAITAFYTWHTDHGTFAWVAFDTDGYGCIDADGLEADVLDRVVLGDAGGRDARQDLWQSQYEQWCREYDGRSECVECAYCHHDVPGNALGLAEGRSISPSANWEVLALGHSKDCEWVRTRAFTRDEEA